MPLPKCPICGTEHILKTDPRHGGNDLTDCVKALKAQVDCLVNGGASEAILSRFASIESMLTQKVCFTTFDEKVAELAGAHRSLEQRVASLDAKGSATLPENASPPAPTPAEPPVTQTAETTGPAAV
jgi:hypothetical protein